MKSILFAAAASLALSAAPALANQVDQSGHRAAAGYEHVLLAKDGGDGGQQPRYAEAGGGNRGPHQQYAEEGGGNGGAAVRYADAGGGDGGTDHRADTQA